MEQNSMKLLVHHQTFSGKMSTKYHIYVQVNALQKTKEAIRTVQLAADDEVQQLKSKLNEAIEAHEL